MKKQKKWDNFEAQWKFRVIDMNSTNQILDKILTLAINISSHLYC